MKIAPIAAALVVLLSPSHRVSAQDLTRMTAEEFMALELVHQHAVAGAVLGMLLVATDAADQADHARGTVAECIRKWQAEAPDHYVITLTTTWVEMAELNAAAAGLGDSVTVATWNALPIAESFTGLLLMACASP